MRLALALIGFGLCVATSAEAAPWSFEIPPGYTERPGIVDDTVAKLRSQPGSVSIDAQAFVAADENVQLTRITWKLKMPTETTKRSLDAFEWGVTKGAAKESEKHISDARHFESYQLVGVSVDESAGVQVHHRRLYAVDPDGVVTLFWIMCAGPADALAECTKAQQTMVLSLPTATEIPESAGAKDLAELIGKVVGGVLAALVVIWLVRRRNQS